MDKLKYFKCVQSQYLSKYIFSSGFKLRNKLVMLKDPMDTGLINGAGQLI